MLSGPSFLPGRVEGGCLSPHSISLCFKEITGTVESSQKIEAKGCILNKVVCEESAILSDTSAKIVKAKEGAIIIRSSTGKDIRSFEKLSANSDSKIHCAKVTKAKFGGFLELKNSTIEHLELKADSIFPNNKLTLLDDSSVQNLVVRFTSDPDEEVKPNTKRELEREVRASLSALCVNDTSVEMCGGEFKYDSKGCFHVLSPPTREYILVDSYEEYKPEKMECDLTIIGGTVGSVKFIDSIGKIILKGAKITGEITDGRVVTSE